MCFSPVALTTLDKYICVDKLEFTEQNPEFMVQSLHMEKSIVFLNAMLFTFRENRTILIQMQFLISEPSNIYISYSKNIEANIEIFYYFFSSYP